MVEIKAVVGKFGEVSIGFLSSQTEIKVAVEDSQHSGKKRYDIED